MTSQTHVASASQHGATRPFARQMCIIDTPATRDMITHIQNGNLPGVLETITKGGDTRWRNPQNWDVLMLAIAYRREEVALALIERHDDLSICLSNLETTGRTTLRLAMDVGMTKVVDALKARGAVVKDNIPLHLLEKLGREITV